MDPLTLMLVGSLASGAVSGGGGVWNMYAATQNANNQRNQIRQQYDLQVQQENYRQQQSYKSINQNVSNTGTDFASRGLSGDYTSSSVENSSLSQENQQHQLVMDNLNNNLDNQLSSVNSQENSSRTQSAFGIAGAVAGTAVSMAGSWLNYSKTNIPNTNPSQLQSSSILNQNLSISNPDSNNFGQIMGYTSQFSQPNSGGLGFGSDASISTIGASSYGSIPDYTSLYGAPTSSYGNLSTSRMNGLNNSWMNTGGKNNNNPFGWNF